MIAKSKVVAVVLVIGVAVWLVGAQFISQPSGPAQLTVVQPAAGLAGTSVVNIDSYNSAPDGQVYIPTESSLSVYTVPANRWLLLTDVEIISSYPQQLAEVAESITTIKRGPYVPGPYHSVTGLAFAPGTQVTIHNFWPLQVPVTFSMTGYLTRP